MLDLDPLRHIVAERSSEKLSLHLIQWMILLYGLSCFLAVIEAILLYTTFAVGPIPPDVEKTRGENDPCSTSLMR